MKNKYCFLKIDTDMSDMAELGAARRKILGYSDKSNITMLEV